MKYDVLSKRMNNDVIFRNDIINKTHFLNENSTNVHRLWHILNDVYFIPKCKNCNSNASFSHRLGKNKGYNLFCSDSCKISYINKNRTETEKIKRMDSIKKLAWNDMGLHIFHNLKKSKIKK